MRHWVIVGAMGAGKTTVGRALAARVGRPFVDNDEQLEAAAGTTARLIQAERGVDALHQLEAQVLIDALASATPAVIAAAASVIASHEVRAALADRALVVWLKAEPDDLVSRVSTQSHRPLAADVEALFRSQFTERAPLYTAAADVTADAMAPVGQIVDTVRAQLESIQDR